MLAAVESGETRVIVAWNWDRLTRNSRDRFRLIQLGRERHVTIALVQGSDLDMSTPSGRLTAEILGAVAQSEIEVKGERQSSANAQSARMGKPPGGPVPFGFTRTRDEHGHLTLEPRPEQAELLRAAYDSVLRGGTLAGVARAWGEPWQAETVKRVLLNPRNAGLREYKGQTYPGNWAPIVDEGTWRATVASLSGRESPPTGARHMLTGIALCGVCGATVQAGARTRGAFRYRCRTLGHVARRGDVIDEYVAAVVVARLSLPDASSLLANGETDTAPIYAEIDRLEAQRSAITRHLGSGLFDEDTLIADATRIRDEIAGLRDQLADAGRVDTLGPLVTAEDVQAAWDAMPTDHRRRVVETLMTVTIEPVGRGKRTFDPDTLTITPRV